MKPKQGKPVSFTRYQTLVIAMLALCQFTIVLDFMVMAPLGDLLMKSIGLNTSQFSTAVSAYAFSAGISGILAAGFADKYDRKKLLVIFYVGFTLGTLVCAFANTHAMLMAGRIVTGLFGGVLGAVSMAIVADLFSFEQRGRVMGFVQMSFAVSQVLGIPIGLFLANRFDWHAPFFLIVGVCIVITILIFYGMKPVTAHMKHGEQNPLVHLQKTVSTRSYWLPFITTALLSIGGFMLMPFTTPFMINNVGVRQEQLPGIYVVMGACSMVMMPLIGKLSDKLGKWRTFLSGTILAMIMVAIYTNMGPSPVWQVILVSAVMFAGVMSRMIPSTALMTAIPKLKDRGAFMSINGSLQQIAGGVASLIAGAVIVQARSGHIYHFDTLGYICIGVMIVCAVAMYRISRRVSIKEPAEAAHMVDAV